MTQDSKKPMMKRLEQLSRISTQEKDGGVRLSSGSVALVVDDSQPDSGGVESLQAESKDKEPMQEDDSAGGKPDKMQEGDDDPPSSPARFRIEMYSGAPVLRWYGQLIVALEGIETPMPMVALLGHMSTAISGVIETANLEPGVGLVEEGYFIDDPVSKKVQSWLNQKVPMGASMGIEAIEVLELKAGEMALVNGREITGPAEIWNRSRQTEGSFTATPADRNTKAAALNNSMEGNHMADENNNTPVEVVTQADAGTETLQGGQGDVPVPQAADPATPVTVEKLTATDMIKLSRQASTLGISLADVEKLAEANPTKELLTEAILSRASSSTPTLNTVTHVDMGAQDSEKLHDAMRDGVLMQHGFRFGKSEALGKLAIEKPSAGAEDFRGATLQSLLRECLSRRGVQSAYRMNNFQVAQLSQSMFLDTRAGFEQLSSGGGSSASIGDFPAILGDTLNRFLLMNYMESPATFMPFIRRAPDAKDFRTIYGTALSEAPDLKLLAENEETPERYLRDKQETYAVRKYGEKISLTLEQMVNDDLSAFMRMAELMGMAARRKESDVVYGLFTANPTMNEDSIALFNSAHNNLFTGAALSTESLTEAKAAMRLQRGFNSQANEEADGDGGAFLNLEPAVLVVPPSLETIARMLLQSTSSIQNEKNAGVINVFQNSMDLVIEPRLENSGFNGDSTNWYLFASPKQIDTIEMANLSGYNTPITMMYDVKDRHAMCWNILHIFGVGLMDWRGVSKNPGA